MAHAEMSTKQANTRFWNLESVVLPSAAWTNHFRFDILHTLYATVARCVPQKAHLVPQL